MTKNPAAVALGSIKSPRKAKTSAENGKLGGRPKSIERCALCNKPYDHPSHVKYSVDLLTPVKHLFELHVRDEV